VPLQANQHVPQEVLPRVNGIDADKNLQPFLQEMSNLAPNSILKTPAKKVQTRKEEEPPAVRRSGRLAATSKSKGRKSVEEIAQEILRSKLGGPHDPNCSKDQARDQIMKLSDAPIPQEAMEAIEDLLKVIKLDNKKSELSSKAGKKMARA
jgi:hypothetical protein